MKMDPKITLEDFSAEMQHRVIRYSLRSLTVRQALRFARKHDDPEFYRIATNKIHAQRQFQREMNGPGVFERVFDYFSLGSLREVVVTLLLVGLAVVGIDEGRKLLNQAERPSTFEQMDMDQLAKRLGILLEDSRGPVLSTQSVHSLPRPESKLPIAEASVEAKQGISDEDVKRIVAAVLVAMQERDRPADNPSERDITQHLPTESKDEIQDSTVIAKISLVSSELTEPPSPE